MKTLTTLERPAATTLARTILSKDGFHAAVLTLTPGNSASLPEELGATQQLLFVITGQLTLHAGELHTILGEEEAVLVPAGRECTVETLGSEPARLLRIQVPPRQIVTPPLVTMER